jgi:hypothetical protein
MFEEFEGRSEAETVHAWSAWNQPKERRNFLKLILLERVTKRTLDIDKRTCEASERPRQEGG